MSKSLTKRKINTSTVAIIVLSILLVASIAIGATLAYFTAEADVTGTITLGDPVNISITQGGSAVTTLTFTDDAMPGTVYDQAIGVLVPADTSNCLLRAKVVLTEDDGTSSEVTATATANWQENDADSYYYYKGVGTAGDAIDFITSITVPTSLTNEAANSVYTVNVIVEAIQEANYAAANVWTDAPADWIATYATAPAVPEET